MISTANVPDHTTAHQKPKKLEPWLTTFFRVYGDELFSLAAVVYAIGMLLGLVCFVEKAARADSYQHAYPRLILVGASFFVGNVLLVAIVVLAKGAMSVRDKVAAERKGLQ